MTPDEEKAKFYENEGDMDGRATWLRILAAIEELQNTETVGTIH